MIIQLKQPIFFAMGLSLLIHGLFFLPNNSNKLSQTSKGHNQLILLENSPHKKVVISPQEQGKIAVNQAIPKKLATLNSPSEIHAKNTELLMAKKVPQVIQTSNQGDLLNQSGKDSSVQHKYQHIIYQHLLNKMESAPYSGSANVTLKIISAGIAINVEIDQTSGQAGYKPWLLQKILSSNPMPPFFSDMKESKINMSISFKHETEI